MLSQSIPVGVVALAAFALLGCHAARRGLQPSRRPTRTVSALPGAWLIAVGGIGVLLALMLFAVLSLDGLDGDPGPVLGTAFDVGFFGGLGAALVGAAWCALAPPED